VSTFILTHAVLMAETNRLLSLHRWVPFKLMFPEGEDELDVPILQISTYASDDLEAHIRLGEVLSSLYELQPYLGSQIKTKANQR
jgi:4,5-DOPA dioxygenase extradiol